MADTKSRFHAHLDDIDLIVLSEDRSCGFLFSDPQGSIVLPSDIPALIDALKVMQFYMQLGRPGGLPGEGAPSPNGRSPHLTAG